jgi:hypothetical protein
LPLEQVRFEGVVDSHDCWGMSTGPSVDGVDVITVIRSKWPEKYPNVRVTLGIEPVAEGMLVAIFHGFTGTDVTPGDPPEIIIGDIDLVKNLYDLDGREVILIVEEV